LNENRQNLINCIDISLKKQNLNYFFFQGDFKSQKEAAWAVTNLTSGGTITQIIALCQYGVLKPMCELLGARDDKVIGIAILFC
jgi:hypothetical protein